MTKIVYRIGIIIAVLIFSFTLAFKYNHSTDNRYRDDLIIGKTKEEIEKVYGKFDWGGQARNSNEEYVYTYNLGKYPQLQIIMGYRHAALFEIWFKDTKAYKVKIEIMPGG